MKGRRHTPEQIVRKLHEVRRIWREEGLKVQPRHHKRRRPAQGEQARRAEHPNHVWAIDFQFDATADGRMLKLANVVDEFTREALSSRTGRTCTADELVEVLEGLVAERGAPEHLRCDNGPELIAWALRDWCRSRGATTSYIEPGAPWENPHVESFNARIRDELLALTEFCHPTRGPGPDRSGGSRTTPNGRTPRSATSHQ